MKKTSKQTKKKKQIATTKFLFSFFENTNYKFNLEFDNEKIETDKNTSS